MTETLSSKPLALIKVGGDVLLSKQASQGLAENLKQLYENDWDIITLHGGGPQVNALQTSLGITPNKVAGRRITSESDIQQVVQAIAGEVNVALTNLLLSHKLPALGVNGAANIIHCKKRPPMKVTGINDLVDFGAVGDVTHINHELLSKLLSTNLIPVIGTLGRSVEGELYNINADTTAVAIAEAMQADILVMVTAVGGIYRDINDKQSLITTINRSKAESYINDQIITDGMIPKVYETLSVVEKGVGQVVITSLTNKDNMKMLLEDPDNYNQGTRMIH